MVSILDMCLLLNVLCLARSMSCTSQQEIEDCVVRFEDNGACACSEQGQFGPVKCHDNKSIEIHQCYCMYYDPTLNMSVVGHCFFSCYQYSNTIVNITSTLDLNEGICERYGPLHRTKRFCGHCNDSYGLAVYSYRIKSCVPCEDYGYRNWLQYFAVALLPLTVFYVLAVLLSFNVTSSSLNGIVLVIQCITSSLQIEVIQGSPVNVGVTALLLKIVISIVGVVNLDFFRLVYPSFCVHPNANILAVLCLDYIVALYPFLLIFITYALVTAYDKQYKLLIWIWKPFKMCVNHHRRRWNIRTSLMEIFATFILFSSVKILGLSFQILCFTPAYSVSGKRLSHYYVYLDANIKYFGPKHLPFALLALTICSIFVLLPFLLLLLYPCRCFQNCLNRCGGRFQILHVFMDAFQGSYKTNPRDLRSFSAFYLLLRALMLLQMVTFPSALMLYNSGILSLASAAVVLLVQPYKVNTHNKIDSIFLLFMGIYFVSYHTNIVLNFGHQWVVAAIFKAFSLIFILLYFISLITWKFLHNPIQILINKVTRKSNDGELIESFDRIQDRVNHGQSYPPLLGQSQK